MLNIGRIYHLGKITQECLPVLVIPGKIGKSFRFFDFNPESRETYLSHDYWIPDKNAKIREGFLHFFRNDVNGYSPTLIVPTLERGND